MNQAEWYQELADKLDTYTDNDKSFMLWYLLGNHRHRLAEELKLHSEPKDISEYAIKRMMIDHMKAIEEIRDVLQEEIF